MAEQHERHHEHGRKKPSDAPAQAGASVGGFKRGDHVVADFGEGEVIAHVVAGPEQNAAGETKYRIQAPDGKVAELGYREPKDRDEHGSGRTFWSL